LDFQCICTIIQVLIQKNLITHLRMWWKLSISQPKELNLLIKSHHFLTISTRLKFIKVRISLYSVFLCPKSCYQRYCN
jgi:hypothetical protein